MHPRKPRPVTGEQVDKQEGPDFAPVAAKQVDVRDFVRVLEGSETLHDSERDWVPQNRQLF